jgi:hypothetical protein
MGKDGLNAMGPIYQPLNAEKACGGWSTFYCSITVGVYIVPWKARDASVRSRPNIGRSDNSCWSHRVPFVNLRFTRIHGKSWWCSSLRNMTLHPPHWTGSQQAVRVDSNQNAAPLRPSKWWFISLVRHFPNCSTLRVSFNYALQILCVSNHRNNNGYEKILQRSIGGRRNFIFNLSIQRIHLSGGNFVYICESYDDRQRKFCVIFQWPISHRREVWLISLL